MSQDEKGESLGRIIAKVQEDLQYLRDAAAKGFADDGERSDLKTIDMVISRTEQGIQAVAEKVLQSTHDQISTLPAVARRGISKDAKPESHIKKHRRTQSDVLPDLSAGQFCLVKHMSQLVGQPANPLTNKILADYYDLPSKEQASGTPTAVPGQILVGSTVKNLTTLPRQNKRDPLLTPPPISHTDACKGLLSLLERGLIPPAAEIVLSPPPIQPQSLRLHTPSKQHIPQKIADGIASQLAGIKLDATINRPSSVQIPSVPKSHSPLSQDFPAVHQKILEIPEAKAEPPFHLPPIISEKKTSYKIIIQNGHLVDGTRDFTHFKKEQQKQWRQILSVLKAVVKLCRDYAIPLCIIDSNRLVTLSMEYELGLLSSKEDLLGVMINRTDIQGLLSIPGQRYAGQNGRDAAATKIAATFHMYQERKKYLDYRHRKWAAGILSMAWLTCLKIHTVKKKLKNIRLSHVKAHQYQITYLQKRWFDIQSGKRIIIHMASQGYCQPVRASIHNFQIEQSLQAGRLCDIEDPNVEVIYVSPRPLGKEMVEYHHRLLAMGPAGETAKHRVHFVSPEKLKSFKVHNMSLSSLILYSPTCLSRIKRLIVGKAAYIVSGTVCKEDLALAYELGVPLLGSEPDISNLYTSKAGARRLLADAGVTIPPYKADIFSQDQLCANLASLIANHPKISSWMFKLPQHINGRGFAYCDMSQHLPCYDWVVKEASRYNSQWTKCWAQEQAITTITSYLPDTLTKHAIVADTVLYPQWKDFLTDFLQRGGLIEGIPPSDSITPVAVDVLIDPTGQTKVLCTQDQICSERYKVWGSSTPQASVPHCQLMEVVDKVATACKARGILGHLTIDFLTFIDPASMQQMLWCVDLDLTYSNSLALYQLMCYLTGFRLNPSSGTLSSSTNESYYAVLAPHLYHTNLSPLYHSIFFQMCKAHFIGYDPKTKVGTIFNLVDDQYREYLGMICIQRSLLRTMQTCSSNLSIIHQEISTPSMQGHSNFKVVIKELDKIIELIYSNR